MSLKWVAFLLGEALPFVFGNVKVHPRIERESGMFNKFVSRPPDSTLKAQCNVGLPDKKKFIIL